MAGFRVEGNITGNVAEVNTAGQLKIVPEIDSSLTANVGCVATFGENDVGTFTGARQLLSPETDLDFRGRSANDALLDQEIFSYAAQNTGKHLYRTTTLTNAWTVNGLQTNSGSITTISTGTIIQSYAYFPILNSNTLSVDLQIAFSAQPTANTVIDFGLFLAAAANPYAPSDGVYFRLTSAGLQGVINYNGTETTTAVFPGFTYVNNTKYQFILYITPRFVEFWYNDNTGPANTFLLGILATPNANGAPCMSAALPLGYRHVIVGGAAGSIIQSVLSNYNVRSGGFLFADDLPSVGNRAYGSYQGLSGGTLGSLANYANSANPAAAVPTNTTAALGSGLGGQFWETASLAVNTDGVICSFQNPAGTVNVQGRRLVIKGVSLWSYIQTVIVGGPFIAQWSLAFGHTTVSLATAEAIAAKAPRRIALCFDQLITAAQAVSTKVAQTFVSQKFDAPIYVNPGEFIALVTKHIGTVGTSGTIAHVITFDYGWE